MPVDFTGCIVYAFECDKVMFQITGPIMAAVALDEGSEETLRQADILARAYDVKLHICHVRSKAFPVRSLCRHLRSDGAFNRMESDASVRDDLLKCFPAVTTRESKEVSLVVEQGSVYRGILRAAERMKAGAVVIGGKDDHTGSPVLGSTAKRIVRHAHCIVVIARRSRDGKVLAATDFSDPTLPVVEAAAVEARIRRAELTVIHSVELVRRLVPAYGPAHDIPKINLADEINERAQAHLNEYVGRFHAQGGGILSDGLAAASILEAARELPAQLIVIGTHGRRGLRRLVLGSVAEAVVCAAPCSTMLVRLA
jgi:nucleotide-binding universal stress UspA family protein